MYPDANSNRGYFRTPESIRENMDGKVENGQPCLSYQDKPVNYGYHIADISKGELGQISKITEEYLEFLDAANQKNPIMELVELSDLLGAIQAYTMNKYNIGMDGLLTMMMATERAFKNGHRS